MQNHGIVWIQWYVLTNFINDRNEKKKHSSLTIFPVHCIHVKHVPIPMTDIDCPKKCCNARYCPLVLAWATMVHKFQGFEAGFEKDNHIKRIIADINNFAWEKQHPGTAYVVASRAKTIGKVNKDVEYPIKSNLFFSGTRGEHRFKRCLYKENGEKCLLVQNRERWVEYLTTRMENTKARRTMETMRISNDFVMSSLNQSTITSTKNPQDWIVDKIHSPNEIWKQKIILTCLIR